MEERVSRKHHLVLAILHEPANAILSVTWRVECLHCDAADIEGLAVGWRFRYGFAVLAANDGLAGELGVREQLLVAASMVPVAVILKRY